MTTTVSNLFRSLGILIIFVLVFVGCTKQAGKFELEVSVDSNDIPHWNWKGLLKYQELCNGKVGWPDGANLNGNFSRGTDSVKAALNIKVDKDDKIQVSGNVDSTSGCNLLLVGVSGSTTNLMEFPAGKHVINYAGKLDAVYDQQKH
jgi:hypothetical protein